VPPRVRLSGDEAARLPALLAAAAQHSADFPRSAAPEAQAAWVWNTYGSAAHPLSAALAALLLFEHGVHRSAETVARQLEAARAAQRRRAD